MYALSLVSGGKWRNISINLKTNKRNLGIGIKSVKLFDDKMVTSCQIYDLKKKV